MKTAAPSSETLLPKRLSPDVAEVLHMLKSLEAHKTVQAPAIPRTR